jgi:hypothetical protein
MQLTKRELERIAAIRNFAPYVKRFFICCIVAVIWAVVVGNIPALSVSLSSGTLGGLQGVAQTGPGAPITTGLGTPVTPPIIGYKWGFAVIAVIPMLMIILWLVALQDKENKYVKKFVEENKYLIGKEI